MFECLQKKQTDWSVYVVATAPLVVDVVVIVSLLVLLYFKFYFFHYFDTLFLIGWLIDSD